MILHGFFPMEVRVAAEVRAAVAAGFDVDVIALRGEGQASGRPRVRASSACLCPRARLGSRSVRKEYLGFTFLAGVKAAQLALRRRYGIVQVHNPPDFLLAAAIPAPAGCADLFDVHDLATRHVPHALRRQARHRSSATGFSAGSSAYAARNVVLTVHEPYRQELIVRGATHDKVVVIMNTLDEPRAAAAGRVPETEFRVVYHGTVTPHYGVALLVDAAAQAAGSIPNLSVGIYGDGDSLDGVLERARELGIADRLS